MTTRFVLSALVAAALTVGVASPAFPSEKRTAYTVPFEKAAAPKGWDEFCRKNAKDCQPGSGKPEAIKATAENLGALKAVNDEVNRSIKPMTDLAHYGDVNRWVYPKDGKGDCKTYALLKRQELIKTHLPAGALLLTIVWTKQDQGHAVLIARTTDGDYVLDNLTSNMALWTKTPYDYVKRQSLSNPNNWVYIDGYLQDNAVAMNTAGWE